MSRDFLSERLKGPIATSGERAKVGEASPASAGASKKECFTDRRLRPEGEKEQGYVLTCVACPKSNVVLDV